ncbi:MULTISPECIES: DUF7523 family protein [Natrialba]|uniref:Uncharacterized protein n=1 Tax=Natrialba aegyptia DSM 13077 TaxID=1227491 RepID=M0BHQ7_9EURY|nr:MULTISPECIES: hypothetical protein [Natrialba]ELZ10416.1 hypothetical protein C480_00695 [Natrialba aegyptia DSM 13077]
MSLAAETRRAVEAHPFLHTALRTGVLNYTAAARFLDVEGDVDAIATALRRYADELPAYDPESLGVSVRMESGIGIVDGDDPASELITVGGTPFGSNGGDLTAIYATGAIDAMALATTLERLALAEIDTVAAAVGDETLIVIVDRLDGANAVRTVEDALDRVPAT